MAIVALIEDVLSGPARIERVTSSPIEAAALIARKGWPAARCIEVSEAVLEDPKGYYVTVTGGVIGAPTVRPAPPSVPATASVGATVTVGGFTAGTAVTAALNGESVVAGEIDGEGDLVLGCDSAGTWLITVDEAFPTAAATYEIEVS